MSMLRVYPVRFARHIIQLSGIFSVEDRPNIPEAPKTAIS